MLKQNNKVKVKKEFDGIVKGVNPYYKTVTVVYDGGSRNETFPWGAYEIEPVTPDPEWNNARADLPQPQPAKVKPAQPTKVKSAQPTKVKSAQSQAQGFSQFAPNYWILVQPNSADEVEIDLKSRLESDSHYLMYIWSPEIDVPRYQNIKSLKTGDIVFHVDGTGIFGVSRVTEDPLKTGVPCPYGPNSPYKNMIGAERKVDFHKLIKPIDLNNNDMKNFIDQHYIPGVKGIPSAFQKGGTIHQGSYLHRLEKEIAKKFVSIVKTENLIKDKNFVNNLPQVK